MYQAFRNIMLFFTALFMPKDKVKRKEKRLEKKTVRKANRKMDTSEESTKKTSIKEEKTEIINLKVLRKGSQGFQVEQWQLFLVGQGLLKIADGDFGSGTRTATIKFQKSQGLKADGIVGNSCYGKAMVLGFEVAQDDSLEKSSAYWPAKPDFQALYNDEKRKAAFGEMTYKSDENGKLIITNDWKEKNIITTEIPQLEGISMWGKPKKTGNIYFHKKGAKQMQALWAEWEKEGLLHLVKTWNGTYSARFIRGSKTKLSNHAYGTAFDINVKWNGLAKRPALVGEVGSVRELVQIANKHGFYWGGHFRRKDGMHFEIAKIL